MKTKLFTAILVLSFILGINTTTTAAEIHITCNLSIDGQVFYKTNVTDVYVLHYSNDPGLWGWDWYEGNDPGGAHIGGDPIQSVTIDVNFEGLISYYQYADDPYYYNITFTLMGVSQPNIDATLSDLTINSNTVKDFSPAEYIYDVELPSGTTTIPTVVGIPMQTNATAVTTNATALPGTSTVLVTAPDGITTKTYTINFTVATASTDATLSDLKVDGTTVAGFSPLTLIYDVELPVGTTTVPTVNATANQAGASIVITDATSLPGTTEIFVVAQDGYASRLYKVRFTVAPANTDASLSDLTIDGGTVTNFASTTLTYNVELANGTTTVPTVVGTPTNANAAAVTTDATSLPGASTVLVTASDGTTTQTYTVNFTLASASVNNITNNFKVYPNPANGVFTIELDDISNTHIEISDISGTLIQQFNANSNKTTIDLTNQAKGIYFIKINNNENLQAIKIILK